MRGAMTFVALLIAALAWPPAGAVAVTSSAGAASVGSGPGAAAVHVTASVSPDSATVGDRLHLVLSVDRPSDVRLTFPDVSTDVSPFEVLDSSISQPEIEGGRTVERRDYAIAAFETGELWVPGVVFRYVTAEGDSGSVVSDSLAVTIGSVLPAIKEGEEAGPLDIKPPMELPRRIWPYIVTAVALAALLAGLYYLRNWLRGRRREQVEKPLKEPAVPRRAAHLLAFERLDVLESADLIGRGDIAPFYVRVTEIVRLYMRDRFGVDAIDMTTNELAPAMRAARIEESEIDWATDYLIHADLAKFAKHIPSVERAREDLAGARSFVERTRLRGGDVPAEGEAAPAAHGGAEAAQAGAGEAAVGADKEERAAEPSAEDGGNGQ
ncbi:MAG: hypothetical protein JXB46_02305 [Candidatus Eisenbacteria bacterium]|nr:hypothetical protein [Candidatus Eisenbacteria bacterium]